MGIASAIGRGATDRARTVEPGWAAAAGPRRRWGVAAFRISRFGLRRRGRRGDGPGRRPDVPAAARRSRAARGGLPGPGAREREADVGGRCGDQADAGRREGALPKPLDADHRGGPGARNIGRHQLHLSEAELRLGGSDAETCNLARDLDARRVPGGGREHPDGAAAVADRADRCERSAARERAGGRRRQADHRSPLCAIAPDRRRVSRPRRLRELIMPKELYSASEAAAALGISLDTLRRWDKSGRIKVERDAGNRRVVPASEIERLRGDGTGAHLSARNRFKAIVTEVKTDGLMAQVEMVVSDPVRLVAIVTRDAVDELSLKPGMSATAIVKSTNVIIQS